MECYDIGQVRFKPFGWCEVNQDHRLEYNMMAGNRDQAEGKLHARNRKTSKASGKLTENSDTLVAGKTNILADQVQGEVG